MIINGATGEQIKDIRIRLKELEENSGIILDGDKKVYVSPNGNDESGDGTQENPWGTIQKAVDECPRLSQGNAEYIIYLADGTYEEETVLITDKDNIIFKSISDTPNIIIKGCVVVYRVKTMRWVAPITLDISDRGHQTALALQHNAYLNASGGLTVIGVGGNHGVYVGASCQFATSNYTVSGMWSACFVQLGKMTVTGSITCEDLTWGIRCEGGIVTYGNITFTNVTSQIYTANGGRVYTGDQYNTGSYTGNGSATQRIIATGSNLGDALLIYDPNNSNISIVTPYGAMSCRTSNKTYTSFANNEAKFESGVLTIASSNAAINYSGYKYYYQLL